MVKTVKLLFAYFLRQQSDKMSAEGQLALRSGTKHPKDTKGFQMSLNQSLLCSVQLLLHTNEFKEQTKMMHQGVNHECICIIWNR